MDDQILVSKMACPGQKLTQERVGGRSNFDPS
jgi:hypothetical protein